MEKIVLDGESLDFDAVLSVAYGTPGSPEVELAPDAA